MKVKNINKRIKKWSDFLADAAIHPSNVYPVGLQFVYDQGQLPSGMSNITPGDILNLQRENGMSACDVPGHVDDWVTIDGNPGDSGGGSSSSQLQRDQTLSTAKDFIKNKPTKVSQFANDANYATKDEVNAKQEALVSGTNIKTVNGESLLGSGNISIPVVVVDQALSSTSTNPVQNKRIFEALANKVDKVSGKQLSTEDFTTAFKQKLEAMPTISVDGDVLIINGKEYKLSPVPVVADYYIGFTNGTKSEFAALSTSQLTALAEGYMISSKPQYEHAYGDNQIFFLMYQANKAPKTVNLISSGQTMAQDLETDNTCPHDPVTIDGTTYKIFGIRLSSTHDASDVMSLTF